MNWISQFDAYIKIKIEKEKKIPEEIEKKIADDFLKEKVKNLFSLRKILNSEKKKIIPFEIQKIQNRETTPCLFSRTPLFQKIHDESSKKQR